MIPTAFQFAEVILFVFFDIILINDQIAREIKNDQNIVDWYNGTITKAKYPKALIGIKEEKPFERKANAVVLDVARMAL